MSKKARKNYVDPSLGFKQEIAVYIVQIEAVAIFLELFKLGHSFWDTLFGTIR